MEDLLGRGVYSPRAQREHAQLRSVSVDLYRTLERCDEALGRYLVLVHSFMQRAASVKKGPRADVGTWMVWIHNSTPCGRTS